MTIRLGLRTLVWCAGALTVLGLQGARAAEAEGGSASDSGALEEIVVTARYRTESLQNTPLSITALSGADMEARGVVNVADLTLSVPSTTLTSEGSTGGNTLVAYIRGLGQSNFSLANRKLSPCDVGSNFPRRGLVSEVHSWPVSRSVG